MQHSHSVSISLTADTRDRVDAEARRRGITRSLLVAHALRRILNEYEPEAQETPDDLQAQSPNR